MKKYVYLFLVLLVSLLLVGCGEAASGGNDIGVSDNEGIVIETSRKIYYSVYMYIDADDVNESVKFFNKKAFEFNGYFSNSNISQSGRSSIIYRIPTDKLEQFLDHIESDTKSKVTDKTIESTDITSKYNKVSARLDILYASRKTYLSLLEEERNLSNIIMLQNKLEDIDSEILLLENEKNSYDNILEYSTITIYFNAKPQKENFFVSYFEYFISFFKVIGMIVLYSLPFGILAGIILTIITVSVKLKKKRGQYEEK